MSDLKLQQHQNIEEFIGNTLKAQKSLACMISPGASKLSTSLGGLLAATPDCQGAWDG